MCSVGIVHDGRVLAEISFDIKSLHDRVLTEAIQRLLYWSGMELPQVHAIAISAGPGSFTGLRIGMGVAKGLAFAQDKPIIAVNTLLLQAAAAAPHARAFAQGRGVDISAVRIVPVLQSRRGEVYTATYAWQAPLPAQREQDKVVAIPDFPATLTGMTVLCGNGVAALQETGALGQVENMLVVTGPEARLSGGGAARLGEFKYQRGEIMNAEELEPFYVQDFNIEPRSR